MAIRKIVRSKTYKLSNVLVLDKSDIEYIINLLHSNHINNRNIILDNFSVDYINEIEKLVLNEVSHLEITGFRNEDDIKIILNSTSSKIIVFNEDDTMLRTIAEQIVEHLKKKTNKWDTILPIYYFGSIIPAIIISILLFHNIEDVLVFPVLFFIANTALMRIIIQFIKTKIIIRKKLSFYKRNRDAIIISILSTIIGVILGGAITYLLN